jgi:hypothetical protein
MFNDQRPMIIEYWTFCISHSIAPVRSRRSDAARENRQQFVALVEQWLQPLIRTDAHFGHQLQPNPRFPQFPYTDPKLVNEVAPGLGALDLAIIR